jgi:hypothetical protein
LDDDAFDVLELAWVLNRSKPEHETPDRPASERDPDECAVMNTTFELVRDEVVERLIDAPRGNERKNLYNGAVRVRDRC